MLIRKQPVPPPAPTPEALAQAARLLDAAIQDSETPVMALATALTRISRVLTQYRTNPPLTVSSADLRRRLIEKEVATCVEALQFHDRLVQQLAAVRALLDPASSPCTENKTFRADAGTIELF